MGPIPHVDASFAGRVLDQLRSWPVLNVCRVDCGAGSGLALHTRHIVHLHSPNEAELYLTWPVILRMHHALLGSGQVMLEPGSDWVRVRLDSESDIGLLLSLVSVAIHANAAAVAEQPHRWTAPCPKATFAAVLGRKSPSARP